MRLLFLSLITFVALNASYVKWYSDYELAHKIALKENKHMLVLLVDKKDNKLISENFINQTYVEEINREFISVYVMKDQSSSYPIELLYTLEYPAIFFLNRYELYSCESLSGEITPFILSKKLKECY